MPQPSDLHALLNREAPDWLSLLACVLFVTAVLVIAVLTTGAD